MNALTHWNPLRDIHELQHRVLHALGQSTHAEREPAAVADWVPVVDIIEDEKEFLVLAELPGVARENVRVTVEKGRLTIAGERRLAQEGDGRKYHRVERSYGSFSRSFNLPENADPERVEASYKDGVLHLHLLKQEQARPRQIEVRVE
jgi:HSP20 family protein